MLHPPQTQTQRHVRQNHKGLTILRPIVMFSLLGSLIGSLLLLKHNGYQSYPSINVTDPICGSWNISVTPMYFTAVSGISKNSIWFAGTAAQSTDKQKSAFGHWNGSELVTLSGPEIHADALEIRSLDVTDDQEAWAVGYTSNLGKREMITFRWDRLKWQIVATPDLSTMTLTSAVSTLGGMDSAALMDVSSISSNDAWAVGYYEVGDVERTLILHWDGSAWVKVPSPNVDSGGPSQGTDLPIETHDNRLYTIISVAKDDIWAFGVANGSQVERRQSLALHWNGKIWEIVENPHLGLIAASSIDKSRNIWIINGSYNAESWLASGRKEKASDDWITNTMPQIELPILTALDAYSPDDVWAVGYKQSDYPVDANWEQKVARSLVLHWNGIDWNEMPGPDPSYIQQLYDVTAVDRQDVWVVGKSNDNEDHPGKGLVAHFAPCSK